MAWVREAGGGVTITVRASPRAACTAVQGVLGDALKVRVAAPPVDGKANVALVEFLAGALGVPRSRVRIESGETGRTKRIRVDGVRAADVAARLGVGG